MQPETLVKEGSKAAVQAGLTLLESSLVGAFSILSLAVGVTGVWLAFRAQNARVEDQKALNERIGSLITDHGAITAQNTVALARVNDRLGEADTQRRDANTAVLTALAAIQTTLNSITTGLMSRLR